MFAVANFPVIEAHKIFLSMWTFLFISTTFFLWYLEPIPGGIIRCMHACYVLNRLDRFTVWERKYNNNKKKIFTSNQYIFDLFCLQLTGSHWRSKGQHVGDWGLYFLKLDTAVVFLRLKLNERIMICTSVASTWLRSVLNL